MIFVSLEKMQDIVIPYHKRHHIPYTMRQTKNHVYLDSNEGNYMTEDHAFPMRELIYIQQFKKHAIESGVYKKVPKINHKNIQFYLYNGTVKPGSIFKNCFEIDLKSAYWERARRIKGMVPDNLHQKTIDINPKTGKIFMSKMTRLAAIGSLAKHEYRFYFDGKKEHKKRGAGSPLTEHVWDFICYEVGKTMSKAAKHVQGAFIFFWVDAIFVTTNRDRGSVTRIFKKSGYDVTVKKIKKIQFNEKKILVTDKDGERPFAYSHRTNKK